MAGNDLGVVVREISSAKLRDTLLSDGISYAREQGLSGNVVVTPRDEAVLYGQNGAAVPLSRGFVNGMDAVIVRYEV